MNNLIPLILSKKITVGKIKNRYRKYLKYLENKLDKAHKKYQMDFIIYIWLNYKKIK